LWSISKKLAAAVGVGAGLSILGMAGYAPNVDQTPEVKLALRTLYALVPSICNLLALLVAIAYPIDDKIHKKIKQAIIKKRGGEMVEDPLK